MSTASSRCTGPAAAGLLTMLSNSASQLASARALAIATSGFVPGSTPGLAGRCRPSRSRSSEPGPEGLSDGSPGAAGAGPWERRELACKTWRSDGPAPARLEFCPCPAFSLRCRSRSGGFCPRSIVIRASSLVDILDDGRCACHENHLVHGSACGRRWPTADGHGALRRCSSSRSPFPRWRVRSPGRLTQRTRWRFPATRALRPPCSYRTRSWTHGYATAASSCSKLSGRVSTCGRVLTLPQGRRRWSKCRPGQPGPAAEPGGAAAGAGGAAAGAGGAKGAGAGMPGSIGPGPWEQPGNQPAKFYIGNAAHKAIAEYYRVMHRARMSIQTSEAWRKCLRAPLQIHPRPFSAR